VQTATTLIVPTEYGNFNSGKTTTTQGVRTELFLRHKPQGIIY
jgi:hypothetical protein